MNTRSRFIVLALLALGVLCDADAQKFRGMKPRFTGLQAQDAARRFGGAISPLDAIAQVSSLSPVTTLRPTFNNLLGRRLLVPQQYATIQTAIDSAVHGDTVLVSSGTYYENINFRGKAIVVASYMILSGDTTTRNNTIINGSQPIDPNRGSVVSFVSGEDTMSVIYGLTITGGTGSLYDSTHRVGGGVYCRDAGARVSHNKIAFNTVTHDQECDGGGIGSWPIRNVRPLIIEDNVVESNSVTAGYWANGGGIRISQGRIAHNMIRLNTISGQAAFGGGGGIAAFCDTAYGRTLVKIIGNTITHNQAKAPGTYGGFGGGVDIVFSNLHLLNNIISDNTVSGGSRCFGGGVRIWRSSVTSMIKDNIISFNSFVNGLCTGGGLHLEETSGLVIQGNHFTNNTAYSWGGGMADISTSGSVISGNEFIGNSTDPTWSAGGGVGCYGSNDITITGNLFKDNSAFQCGGLAAEDCDLLLTNNIFTQNEAEWGGAIGVAPYSSRSNNQIIDNTITENVADTVGGIWVGGNVIVLNTICWGNSAALAPEIMVEGGELNMAHSDVRFGADSIQIGTGGTLRWLTGNITSNPTFRDTTMRLADASPCIGAGIDSIQINGTWLHAPPLCFYGSPRPSPSGSRPDIGACENYNGLPRGWIVQSSGTTNSLWGVSFIDANIGTAVGELGTILRTTNGGATWESQSSGTTNNLYGVSFTDGNNGTAVGTFGTVLRTTNGGATWRAQSSGTTTSLLGVSFTDANTGTAVGYRPLSGPRVILRTTNGGVNWTTQDTTYLLRGVCFTDASTGTVVGFLGTILRTTNGGSTWTSQVSGTNAGLGAVSFVDANNGIAVGWGLGDGAVIVRTTDGGTTWTKQTGWPNSVFTGVSLRYAGVGTVVGELQTSPRTCVILRTTNGGATWMSQATGATEALYSVCFTDANTGTAVGRNGTIIHTTSGGVTSTEDESKLITEIPSGFRLEQNYPNPFNPSTTIRFQIPHSSFVTLKVFDILGREVATLVDEVQGSGFKTVQFDASGLASGVYLYRLKAGEYVNVKRMVVIK